jgi:putative FmdB family regulatory protein
MPIYEFHCEECGQDFESLIMGSDEPECTVCQSKNVCKLMSTCGFISKSGNGETVRSTASASSCSGCASTNCGSCGH